jgi:hypothetical protein
LSKKFTHYSRDPDVRSVIAQSMCLRLTEKEIMTLLAKQDIKFTRKTLYNIKEKIKKNVIERVNTVYDYEMLEEHFLAIETIQLAQKRMWECYEAEPDPYRKCEIATQAVNTLPFLSGYYKSIKEVLRLHKSIQIQKDNIIPI